MFAVDIESVFGKGLSAGTARISLELYFFLALFLPGERKEDDGECASHLRYCLSFYNRIYASNGFHRCKTTSCITHSKGHIFAQGNVAKNSW